MSSPYLLLYLLCSTAISFLEGAGGIRGILFKCKNSTLNETLANATSFTKNTEQISYRKKGIFYVYREI